MYHHTAPVNALYGLHESLLHPRRGGAGGGLGAAPRQPPRRWSPAWTPSASRCWCPSRTACPQLNMVVVPDGVDEAAVRGRLLAEYDLEVGAGLGALAGKVWRVGLMGHACTAANVVKCLRAFADILGPTWSRPPATRRKKRRGRGGSPTPLTAARRPEPLTPGAPDAAVRADPGRCCGGGRRGAAALLAASRRSGGVSLGRGRAPRRGARPGGAVGARSRACAAPARARARPSHDSASVWSSMRASSRPSRTTATSPVWPDAIRCSTSRAGGRGRPPRSVAAAHDRDDAHVAPAMRVHSRTSATQSAPSYSPSSAPATGRQRAWVGPR